MTSETTDTELVAAYAKARDREPHFYGSHLNGLRAVYEAGIAAERERAARIAEEFEDYLGAGYISEFTRGHDHAAAGIAAAIREDS